MNRSLLAVLVVASGCWAALGCARGDAAPPRPKAEVTDPTARDFVPPTAKRAQLVLTDSFGGRHAVTAEVADTEPLRRRGLMWRDHLADGEGMLFIFPSAADHSFWMANTLISLDLLFLDDDQRIVGILERLPPQSRESRGVGQASRYVLEVPAGWVARTGVTVGKPVEFASGL